MTHVIDELVEEALRELSDEDAQARLWTASGGLEVSSLAEAKSRLWDDSGLSDAMARGVVYNRHIDSQLRRLRDALHRIEENIPVEMLMVNPQMTTVRAMARDLLVSLRDFGYERSEQ